MACKINQEKTRKSSSIIEQPDSAQRPPVWQRRELWSASSWTRAEGAAEQTEAVFGLSIES